MVTPKTLTPLMVSIFAAGLFLVQPAHALTPTAQPYLASSRVLVAAAQPIAQHRCYSYRDGRRVYRPCPSHDYYKPKRSSGPYGTSYRSGHHKPWSGHEPCANCPSAR
jgi:hypothetical protein